MAPSLKKLKRQHLKKRLEIVYRNLWDKEFLLSQLRQDREKFRMERDRVVEQAQQTKQALLTENKKKDKDKDKIKKLKKLAEQKEAEIPKLEQRINEIDLQSEGPLIDPDDPQQRDQSVKGSIDGYRAVIPYLKDYIKKI